MIKKLQIDYIFAKISKFTISNQWFYLIVGVIIILRVLIGINTHYFFMSNTPSDDALMINYSVFSTTPPLELVKTFGFPLFLFAVNHSGIPYNFAVSLLWIIAALIGMILVGKLTRNKFARLASLVFIIFTPLAFAGVSMRLYRNTILTPMILILILSLAMLVYYSVISNTRANKKIALWSVITGLVLLFSYYIKENGIWMLLLTIGVIAVCAGYVIISEIINTRKKHKLRNTQSNQPLRNTCTKIVISVAIIILPLAIFGAGTFAYKQMNNHFYGVSEINTRTDGEYGKFIKRLTKIEAPDRNSIVWTPWGAVDAAFDSSQTLRSLPNFQENIVNTPWFPQGAKNPIYNGKYEPVGDFLTWSLRDSWIQTTGSWSEREVQTFFAEVNREIDQALREGRIKRQTGRFQIVSSMGGYTVKEIRGMIPNFIAGLKDNLFYASYSYGVGQSDCTREDICQLASKVLNMDVRENGGKMGVGFIANAIIDTYKITAPVVLIIATAGVAIEFGRVIRRKSWRKNVVIMISSATLFVGGLGVLFAITWFTQFIYLISEESQKYGAIQGYSVEALPLFIVAQLLGVYLFAENARNYIKNHHTKSKKGLKKRVDSLR